MRTITITRTIIDHTGGTVDMYYDSAGSVIGTNLHVQLSEHEAPLDDPNWGSDEQCAALADRLDIPVEQVSVATPPEPTEEPTDEDHD